MADASVPAIACVIRGLAIIGVVVAGGCGRLSDDVPSAPAGPSFSEYCVGTPEQCNEVDNSISELENHEDPECQALGETARLRFESGSFGFVVSTAEPYYGWTIPQEMPCSGQCNAMDGYTTGVTYLHPNTFIAGITDGVLTHEEAHHHGADQAGADALEAQCAGSI